MSNAHLTDKELNKVYTLYENYGPDKLGDFIRMIWSEAYNLGASDTAPENYVRGYNDGRNNRNPMY